MASRRISALFFMVIFITALTACGKTGPLYLPGEQADLEKPGHSFLSFNITTT